LTCLSLAALAPWSSALFLSGLTLAAGANAGLVALGIIGAKVAGLAIGLGIGRAASRGQRGYRRYYGRSYYPSTTTTYYPRVVSTYNYGKREVSEDISQVLERTFLDMAEQNTAGCFQRLFCAMAADPTNYQQHLPMMTAAKASATVKFGSEAATEVVAGLNKAAAYGESMASYDSETRAALCEAVYSQCPYTGGQMDFAITQVEKIGNVV